MNIRDILAYLASLFRYSGLAWLLGMETVSLQSRDVPVLETAV